MHPVGVPVTYASVGATRCMWDSRVAVALRCQGHQTDQTQNREQHHECQIHLELLNMSPIMPAFQLRLNATSDLRRRDYRTLSLRRQELVKMETQRRVSLNTGYTRIVRCQ